LTLAIAILGPGALGLSLARHAAERGLNVRLVGRTREHALERLQKAQARWEGLDQGRTTGKPPAWMDRIHASADVEKAIQGCDLFLEALPEAFALKAEAWRRLDALLAPEVLRMTGTSSLSVRNIREAAGMRHPLLGFHLFVPVHRMPIVELALEQDTPSGLRDRVLALAEGLALHPVIVKDQPGLAASRMALAQGLEAIRLLEQGVANAADLDALMVLGYGHPVGPLELSDRIGLDLRLAIAEQLHEATGDPRFEVPDLLQKLVAKGHTGRKAGQGFHAWDARGKRL
jgi:3-hydroxybutyryl-CoA dehydrogenase